MIDMTRDMLAAEWRQIAYSTAPADRVTAEQGVDLAYQVVGLNPPEKLWLRSPLEGVVAAASLALSLPSSELKLAMMMNAGRVVGSNRALFQQWNLEGSTESLFMVHGHLTRAATHRELLSIRERLLSTRDDVLVSSPGTPQLPYLPVDVRSRLLWFIHRTSEVQNETQFNHELHHQLGNAIYGQDEAGWLGFYDLCRHLGIGDLPNLDGVMLVAKSAGWWWPFESVCLLTERRTQLHFDALGRLHNERGPALSYPDGWGMWAIHGHTVSQQIVERPETLTVDDIVDETNAEVRRVMLDGFGRERFIRESGAMPVSHDDWGTLYRFYFPDDETLTMVQVRNSTPEPDGSYREYWLRVHPNLCPMHPDGSLGPPQTLTALNAIASTFGLEGEYYATHMEVQT